MTRYIDADAVYKILESCEIRKATIGNPLTDWEYGYTCGIERAESEIECAVAVDAVPVVHGKWLPIIEVNEYGEPYQSGVYCSECGHTDSYEPNYCPDCGARMDAERKEE